MAFEGCSKQLCLIGDLLERVKIRAVGHHGVVELAQCGGRPDSGLELLVGGGAHRLVVCASAALSARSSRSKASRASSSEMVQGGTT